MHIFSYGSLVNPATHALTHVARARLSGWRRAWRHTSQRQVAYLTIVPDADASIEGVILKVPTAERAGLTTREAAYELIDVSHLLEADQSVDTVLAYAIAAGQHLDPSPETPVLLSYIDVVVQGYLEMFGQQGVEAFFTSTSGWNAPIVDDRAAPLYPRHQSLTPHERSLVDQKLHALGVTFLNQLPPLPAQK